MKIHHAILLAGALPALAAAGEPPSAKAAAISMPSPESRLRLGFSFAPLLNVKAGFSGLGAFSNPLPIHPADGGRDYEYDDGFVRVDDSGNAGGRTAYWGYDNASQYDPAADSVSFGTSNSPGTGRAGETEETSPGFEIFGYLDMGRVAEFSGRPVSWGFKGGLHYANISVGGRGGLTSDVVRVTDSFDTTGIILFPSPGYEGTPGGVGPLIGDDPDRTVSVVADGSTVTGGQDLEVDLVTLSAGPYLEIPVAEAFSVFAEAGLSVSIARGEYEFDSLSTIAGVGSQGSSGDSTRTVLLPGAYAGFSAVWRLTERFGLHGSARYQYLDSFGIHANGTEASLDFDGSAVVSFGAVWVF